MVLLPSPAMVLDAARDADWICGICGTKIAPDDGWVTRMPDLAPCHLECALSDPRVARIDVEKVTE